MGKINMQERDSYKELLWFFTFLFGLRLIIKLFDIFYLSKLNIQERDNTKEFLVYLVDASPKMFSSTCPTVSPFYQLFLSFWLILVISRYFTSLQTDEVDLFHC